MISLSNLFAKLSTKKRDQSASQIPGLKSGKMRQYMVLAGLFAALYFGLYLIFATSAEDKPKKQVVAAQSMTTTHIATGGEVVDVKDRWIGTAGNQMALQDKRLSSQEQATKDLLAKYAQLQSELRDRKNVPASATPSPATPSAAATRLLLPVSEPAATKPSGPTSYPPGSPGTIAAGTIPPPAIASAPAPTFEIGHLHVASSKPPLPATHASAPAPAKAAGAKPTADRVSGDSFLPVGFTKAKLLGGILASTGGQAQSSPMPVFVRIKDLAMLPNEYRANVQDCMVVGAAFGDLAAERVYVRTELLSCIRQDGRVLEVKAAGVLYDNDGKLGLRGRLINKQDKVLMQALFSGVIGGIGQGMQAYSSTTTVTPLGGTVTTPNPGSEIRAGVGAGIGRALDKLATYQISLAEKIFPVIEIDSDREVSVAFTKGIDLPVPLPDLVGAEEGDE